MKHADRSAVLVLSVLSFAVLGLVLVSISRAATSSIAAEPENGAATSPAATVTDTTASGGAAVKFAASAEDGWVNIINDQFNSGGVPAHWGIYDAAYGSDPHNCATPNHVSVSGGSLRLLMKYETSGKCGAAWYTGGMQVRSAYGGVDQRVTVRFRVTGTDLANIRSHRNIPMRWVDDDRYPWYQGEADYCEGSSLTGCSTFLHHTDSTQVVSKAHTFDVTQWHTFRAVHRNHTVSIYIDDMTTPVWTYAGTEQTVPAALRNTVLQQECRASGCPAGTTGSEEIEIDWITVDNPAPVPAGVTGNWSLGFQDEFNGTALDTTKWAPCWFYPTCGTMNGVPTPASNVSVAGGNAVLTLPSSTSGALISTNPRGGVTPGFQFTTGFAEARIYFPGNGTTLYNWPAWWTNGQNWPQDEEHDIAEVSGWSSGNGGMTSNYHYSSNGSHASKGSGTIPGTWSNAYHTYGMHRKATGVDIYYDGVKVHSYTTTGLNPPHYLIINLGYEGKNLMTGTAGQVKVDYVRVWSQAP